MKNTPCLPINIVVIYPTKLLKENGDPFDVRLKIIRYYEERSDILYF